MTHWYREAKRIRLMEHLERAGINFVLCSEKFTEGDLLDLRIRLQPGKLAQRLMLGPHASGDRQKVLVTARHDHPDPEWLQNPETWAGIFVLPAYHPHKENALHSLFTTNRAFQNGTRGYRVISKGVVQRFVLDMRTNPPSLHGV